MCVQNTYKIEFLDLSIRIMSMCSICVGDQKSVNPNQNVFGKIGIHVHKTMHILI